MSLVPYIIISWTLSHPTNRDRPLSLVLRKDKSLFARFNEVYMFLLNVFFSSGGKIADRIINLLFS